MATTKERTGRLARERARAYQERQRAHLDRQRRRRRDDLVAGIVGGVLVLAITGAQVAYYAVGPAAPIETPAPAPSSTADVIPGPLGSTAP